MFRCVVRHYFCSLALNIILGEKFEGFCCEITIGESARDPFVIRIKPHMMFRQEKSAMSKNAPRLEVCVFANRIEV